MHWPRLTVGVVGQDQAGRSVRLPITDSVIYSYCHRLATNVDDGEPAQVVGQ